MDPTNLIVTYAYEHNHSLPLPKTHSSASTTATAAVSPAGPPPEELTVFAAHPDFELCTDSAVLLSHHHHAVFGWFDDVASTGVLESPICGGVEDVTLTMREEDELLFADLGELPECSAVFRQRNILSASAIQCGGVTR